ncbi:Uncharacterised protein [Chryseobacterium gleum]|uniref:Uncharacterized protein n=2 Tax=Chryseobacterium gleum TaxID=250 RepID=A0A3S4MSN2_CHRGE|nr:hypothetical protein [Chryseobacterium gleum]EFK36853.1 hypothetical protein HMPREF0204_11410 [Chryseobacterium gleum ATCC 35910]QQY32102.1 hypothetical protein I6I60_25275 [Chryseobacterium gleum]VEE10674.1 Uncharacterised protein [Chryseobacterium gleum]
MNLPINLHDWTRSLDFKITRVPGGYIYCREEGKVNIANPVFVPLNAESKADKMLEMLKKVVEQQHLLGCITSETQKEIIQLIKEATEI